MSNNNVTTYVAHANASARPATPDVSTGAITVFYADDTGALDIFNGSTWAQVNPLATTSVPGLVTVDGTIITVTAGAITVAKATAAAFGVVKVDGTSITEVAGVISATGASGANPSATASNVAVNGSASTFMRSDAAPAIQLASSSVFGLVKVDGSTITEVGGVISAVGGGGTPGGSSNDVQYNNAGAFGGITLADAKILVGQTSAPPAAKSISGDATMADTGALTLATVNSNVGSFTNANITVNDKGLITAAANGSGGASAVTQYVPVGGGNPVPALSSLTKINNVTGVTFTENPGYALGIQINATPGSITAHQRPYGLVISASSSGTPWRKAFAMQYSWSSTGDGPGIMVGVTDGTRFECYVDGDGASGFIQNTNATTDNTAFSPSGSSTQTLRIVPGQFGAKPVWFAVRNDGTNYYFEESPDGAVWWTRASYPIASSSLSSLTGVFFGLRGPNGDAWVMTCNIFCIDTGAIASRAGLVYPS